MPAFTMDEATVDFNMEVKESSVSADTSSESISNTDTFKFWGCSASITGNVGSQSVPDPFHRQQRQISDPCPGCTAGAVGGYGKAHRPVCVGYGAH